MTTFTSSASSTSRIFFSKILYGFGFGLGLANSYNLTNYFTSSKQPPPQPPQPPQPNFLPSPPGPPPDWEKIPIGILGGIYEDNSRSFYQTR